MINEIRSIREKDPTFGSQVITDNLRDAHAVMGENPVLRLCRESMLYCSVICPKRGSGKTLETVVHDDLLERNFTFSRVNEKYFWTSLNIPRLEF